MTEARDILDLWRAAKARGEEAVLATVIRTRGSSYRLPGARLLLTSSGVKAGSISGGCLEDELIRKAFWFTTHGPVIRRYDTTADGYGLGCNGIIHIYLERLRPFDQNVLDTFEQVRRTRTAMEWAHTPVDGEPAFVERLAPPIRLLICGAGDDAIPLAELAHFLDWEVNVYDGRSHYAKPARFPLARHVSTRPEEITVDPWTVAVVMSHSYSQDAAFLRQLAALRPAYLGLLGPRKRSVQLMEDCELSESDLASALHAPVGLDIGADGPRQVALSVIAEIQAFWNGRQGGELRERNVPIHSREIDITKDLPFHVHSIVCA